MKFTTFRFKKSEPTSIPVLAKGVKFVPSKKLKLNFFRLSKFSPSSLRQTKPGQQACSPSTVTLITRNSITLFSERPSLEVKIFTVG